MTVPALVAVFVMVVAVPLRPRPVREVSASRLGGTDRLAELLAAAAGRLRRWKRAGPPAPATVAEWCGELSRAVRSGESLRVALAGTVPSDVALREATDPIRLGLGRGRPTSAVADDLVARRREQVGRHLGLAGAVIAECGRSGGSAAAPLDRVASALRQRAADDQERAAQAAQARLSANVLTILPLAVLAVLLLDDAVRAALASPAGLALVAVGTALNAAGWWWMNRIVRVMG